MWVVFDITTIYHVQTTMLTQLKTKGKANQNFFSKIFNKQNFSLEYVILVPHFHIPPVSLEVELLLG